RLERATGRGWSPAQFHARDAAQWPEERKAEKAMIVIDNDSNVAHLATHADTLMRRILDFRF
ncbi:MAG: hypothetical protein FWF84_02780, partial [Kiritimatiellaeota bacterium]|nr:hypothetical protein [Kiritimatiellota bacterium]